MLKSTVFLDRDGVINRDSPDYIKSWKEFEFIPGSIDAIADLTCRGYSIFIISNQSAVGRQLASRSEIDQIFNNMRQTVESEGGRITDIFYCPHRPEDQCECRKPKPGLIFQARQKYNIDLSTAVMVGDSLTDIECAKNAGCGYTILVESGYKKIDPETWPNNSCKPDHIAPDLRRAADWIIRRLTAISASNNFKV